MIFLKAYRISSRHFNLVAFLVKYRYRLLCFGLWHSATYNCRATYNSDPDTVHRKLYSSIVNWTTRLIVSSLPSVFSYVSIHSLSKQTKYQFIFIWFEYLFLNEPTNLFNYLFYTLLIIYSAFYSYIFKKIGCYIGPLIVYYNVPTSSYSYEQKTK